MKRHDWDIWIYGGGIGLFVGNLIAWLYILFVGL